MSMGGFERVKEGKFLGPGMQQDLYCNGARHVELTGDLKTRNPVDIRVTHCNCPRPPKYEDVPA